MKRLNIFISHSWKQNHQYEGLLRMLNKTAILYLDYSYPRDYPLVDPDGPEVKVREIRDAIDSQIMRSSCILFLATMHFNHSRWVKYEFQRARAWKKPIIAIQPHDQERLPSRLMAEADYEVSWNYKSLRAPLFELAS